MSANKVSCAIDKTTLSTKTSAFAPIGSPVALLTSRSHDPFASRRENTPADAFASAIAFASTSDDEADGYYAIVPSGPAVAASEVETNVPAIEVMVLWGERDILHVSHLSPLRPFIVGESAANPTKESVSPDFCMEASFLGAEQMPIAIPAGNGVAVVVPLGATISVRQGTDVRSNDALRDGGELRASSALAGSLQYQLREGETARVSLKGFVFQVKAVNAGLPLGLGVRPDPRPFYYVASVGAFAAALFLAINVLLPPPAMLGGDQLDMSNRYVQAMIQQRQQPLPDPVASSSSSSDPAPSSSDPPGPAGDHAHPRWEIHARNPGDIQPSTDTSPPTSDVFDHPVINAMGTIAAALGALDSVFDSESSLNGDAMAALENLVGVPSSGSFGLSPSGPLLGTGGPATDLVGTGRGLDTHGRPDGTGPDGDGPMGLTARGPGHGPHIGFTPPQPGPDDGGLTSAQIRRVVQRNLSQVQHCYEQGLQRNPSLAGRVNVSFMVTPTGAVGAASVANSSLGDARVGTCIASAVRRWAFPQPDSAGPVAIRFPFNLSQGGQ